MIEDEIDNILRELEGKACLQEYEDESGCSFIDMIMRYNAYGGQKPNMDGKLYKE